MVSEDKQEGLDKIEELMSGEDIDTEFNNMVVLSLTSGNPEKLGTDIARWVNSIGLTSIQASKLILLMGPTMIFEDELTQIQFDSFDIENLDEYKPKNHELYKKFLIMTNRSCMI